MAGNSELESFVLTLGFDARKLLTMNAHEQKQLEKIRKSLDKERAAEEARLLRAQRDAIAHLYESQGIRGDLIMHGTRTVTGSKNNPLTKPEKLCRSNVDRFEVPCFVGESVSETGGKTANARKTSLEIPSGSQKFLPELNLHNIMASTGSSVQRSHSWSTRTRPDLRLLKNTNNNDHWKKKYRENSEKKQQCFLHENFKDGVKGENHRRERSLSEILPPAILPPLYSQKVRGIGEKYRQVNRTRTQRSEEVWDNLEDCRYIRTPRKRNSR